MIKKSLSCVSFFVCFIFLLTVSQGCETLHKKFSRQKKGQENSEQYTPILDPVDYPQKTHDPVADYAYRFSLFRVWEKELVANMEDRANPRRLQYFVENIVMQLQEMEKLVVDGQKAELQKAIKDFNGVLETLNKPAQFYNLRDLKLGVEKYAKPIRLHYKPSVMEGKIKS